MVSSQLLLGMDIFHLFPHKTVLFYYTVRLLDTCESKGNVWQHFNKIFFNKISMHHLVLSFPPYRPWWPNLYRFVNSDHNWAVCDFGIKQFNHELVLQSVEEVNVPHPRPVVGEYMGDLPTNTDILCRHVTNKIHEYKYMDLLCILLWMMYYLFPGVWISLQFFFRATGVLFDDRLTISTQELYVKQINRFMKLTFLIPYTKEGIYLKCLNTHMNRNDCF